VPAAGLAASAVLVVVLALTHAEFNRFAESHGSVEHWGQVLSWWILARDVALVGLFAVLVVKLRAAARQRSPR
jgi:heme/copper-type cytochrome/quinol oxidase subunit 2